MRESMADMIAQDAQRSRPWTEGAILKLVLGVVLVALIVALALAQYAMMVQDARAAQRQEVRQCEP